MAAYRYTDSRSHVCLHLYICISYLQSVPQAYPVDKMKKNWYIAVARCVRMGGK